MTKDEALKMAHKTFMQLNERHPRRDNGDGCFDKELKAINEALEQPLTRDWKETIDERVAKDDAFKRALEQPVVMERDYNFMRDLAIGCEDAWNELHKQEPVGYIDKEQLYRWERLRGTPYEAPERAYIGFSKIPFKSDLTDCSLAVYTHPAPSWQGLTDDEREMLYDKAIEMPLANLWNDYAYLIEQALKEKNTWLNKQKR